MDNVVKWVQPILTGLTLAALIGGYNSIVELKIEVTRLQERIEFGMSDRFTGSQGEVLRTHIAAMEQRIASHESRIDALENEDINRNTHEERIKDLENQQR